MTKTIIVGRTNGLELANLIVETRRDIAELEKERDRMIEVYNARASAAGLQEHIDRLTARLTEWENKLRAVEF